LANPQAENGYTKIANEILESLQMYKFNLNEIKVILCVWRYTYGFSRKEHSLSLSYISNHTGLSRTRVNESLKRLIDCEVIEKVEQGNSKTTNVYRFNKNYENWKIEKYTSFTKRNGTSVQSGTSIQNDTSTSVQDDTSTSVQFGTQQNNIKTNIKQEEEKEENPVKKYESIFGILNSVQMQKVWMWVDDFGNKEVIFLAIEETAIKNPRAHFSYFESILKDWYRRKLFTVEKVQREKERFEQAKPTPTKKQAINWEALADE
jgi:phage replication O-like protein O